MMLEIAPRSRIKKKLTNYIWTIQSIDQCNFFSEILEDFYHCEYKALERERERQKVTCANEETNSYRSQTIILISV